MHSDLRRWMTLVEGVGSATNSLGQPLAHTPESLRNFWNWFGRSKVVNKQGLPLVLYHGTKKNFRSFDPARSNRQGGVPIDYHSSYFFTNEPEVAQTYAGQRTEDWGFATEAEREHWKALVVRNDDESDRAASEFWHKHIIRNARSFDAGGHVMPVYLRIEKPLRINARGLNWDEIPYKDDYWASRDLVELAIEQGKDGLIVRRVHDRGEGKGKPSDVYVVFAPNQIKSAIGNVGRFGPDEPIDEESDGFIAPQ